MKYPQYQSANRNNPASANNYKLLFKLMPPLPRPSGLGPFRDPS